METPWLIQRAKFHDSDLKGIDGIIRLDYMGSAEFEFGSIPNSLKQIRAELANYSFFTWHWAFAPDKPITIFCKIGDREEVEKVLVELAHGRLHLKEYCNLNEYLTNTAKYNLSDFWWDIVNNFMFWKQDAEFENKFKEAIKHK